MGSSAASKRPLGEAGESSPALHACGPCAADLTCGQQDVHHIGLAKQSGLMQSTALLRLESKRERRAGVVRTAAARFGVATHDKRDRDRDKKGQENKKHDAKSSIIIFPVFLVWIPKPPDLALRGCCATSRPHPANGGAASSKRHLSGWTSHKENARGKHSFK